ncbi:flagellar hook protein FlgE [Gluconacetobacter sp. Hr-1-5]|uniref:flagellar hook protein FlgE n=1 Tax=Gluconacetobacter sp. Hr-1-5 TaxID=3395370 RepID=UPI003B516554
MSVFNALTTAVSGINAQSTAFTNLSNNIANSQTVGYKATTTAFQDFVAGSLVGNAASSDISDSVSAVTIQHVDSQGTASSSTDSLATSISGSGLFVVSKETGASTATATQFQNTQYYTRNGEFYENKAGYLVNTSGYYLDGYQVDESGTLGTTVQPLNVANVAFRPTQSTTITTTGTLAEGTTPDPATTTVYDGLYNQTAPSDNSGTINVQWSAPTAAASGDGYTATVTISGSNVTGTTAGKTFSTTPASSTYTVNFNSDGTLASVTDGTQNVTSTLTGAAASVVVPVTYPDGTTQSVSVNLGTIGGTTGMTVGTTASDPKLASDSVTSGTFQSISMQSDGSVMATFDNGDTQLVGKIALANFANVDGLNAVDGQAYTATASSGSARIGNVGENATGTLSVGYVESSTTDLTSDLSALIVAQEAYSANTKIVTTADQLLQTTIAMKQ